MTAGRPFHLMESRKVGAFGGCALVGLCGHSSQLYRAPKKKSITAFASLHPRATSHPRRRGAAGADAATELDALESACSFSDGGGTGVSPPFTASLLRTLASISSASVGFAFSRSRAFSRPCPI